ncbi:hypothetical protein [Phormidesmis sp. 146-33]
MYDTQQSSCHDRSAAFIQSLQLDRQEEIEALCVAEIALLGTNLLQ